MADLEQALRELRVEWPATPDLAAAVLPRLETQGARRPRRPWRLRVAAVALLLLGGTMAVEPARSAILEALGLKSVSIERREPVATPEPRGAALGEGLGLGSPVTLERARAEAGFDVGIPDLGEPDAVFLDGMQRVSFMYGAGPGLPRAAETGAGLLVTQQLATVGQLIQKTIGPETKIQDVTVAGDRGYWITGAPHGVAFMPAGGDPVFDEQRLAGPTLLVEHGDVLIRVEGRVSRERAIAVAESVAAGAG